ncbi:MAG: alkaline phosphatase family protein [Victivallales bacterium]|nr:alkaline phosphatase family protein [Victivallales bacterium]
MKDAVHVFIYLTGAGWHILKEHGFLDKYCKYQFPVKSQLGCSQAVLSTVLTGTSPSEHGYFSSCYSRKSSNRFETLQRLYVKMIGKPSGYFGKYSVPMRNLDKLVQTNCHGNSLLPGGFAPLKSIVDLVHERGLQYYIINCSGQSPAQALKYLRRRLKDRSVDFVFIQTDEIDHLLHCYPHDFQKIDQKLQLYERKLKKVIKAGQAAADNFNLTVFSGHGITFAPQRINIKKKIDSLGLDYGNDYHSVYDPTMARFWYKNNSIKSIIMDKLQELRHCRVLTIKDKKNYGIYFPDRRYGETIALVDPGFQISPNDVVSQFVPGMHGYDPEHPDSLGACISLCPLEQPPGHIKDFYNIMSRFIRG